MQQQSLSVPTLVLEQTRENSNESEHLLTDWIIDRELNSNLVEEETHWQEKREYFQDQYLYTDII